MAVGFKQKGLVNEIVKKVSELFLLSHLPFCLHGLCLLNMDSSQFLQEKFVVMLFHYDGVVDEWHELEWSNSIIHVSATNQTKWYYIL